MLPGKSYHKVKIIFKLPDGTHRDVYYLEQEELDRLAKDFEGGQHLATYSVFEEEDEGDFRPR